MKDLTYILFFIVLLSCSCSKLRQPAVSVSEEIINSYKNIKLEHKYRAIVYKISDDLKNFEVEKEYEPKTSYESIVKALPERECRYLVIDFQYKQVDGMDRSKILFLSWVPDAAKVKTKMLYTANKDLLRKRLVGIHFEIQGTHKSELVFAAVQERALRK